MNEKIPTPENNSENFKAIELKIKEPDNLHGLEITFDENDPKLVTVYNVAINEICNKKNNLGMFHQTGIENNPGYHAWEVLGSKNDPQKLSELFSSIHQRARDLYSRFDKLNIFDF